MCELIGTEETLKTEHICQTHYTVTFTLILWLLHYNIFVVCFFRYDINFGYYCKWESKIVVYTSTEYAMSSAQLSFPLLGAISVLGSLENPTLTCSPTH